MLSGLKASGHSVFYVFVRTEACSDDEGMAGAWDGFFSIPYRRPNNRWLKRKYDKGLKLLKLGRVLPVLPYRVDDWYTREITEQLLKISQQVKPDVVLVEYVFLSKVFECFGPDTLKILDTHDIVGNRHRLYQKNDIAPQWFYTSVAQEKKALDRADVVIAIQDEEATYFRQLTRHKVITVGHMVQVSHGDEQADNKTNHLLFVGSSNPINVEALRWFLRDVFPLVRVQLPHIELEVVGGCAEKISARDGLILTGRAIDLASHYRRAKAVINPVRFGTGLKIKAIEALAYGRPLITTRAGAAGLEKWAERAFLVAETPEEFAEAIRKVCCVEDLCDSLTKSAIEFTKTYNREALRPLLSEIK